MTFYAYLKKKVEDGTVKNLYKRGVCTYKITGYLETYEKYKSYLDKNESISKSVEKTAIDLNISDRTTWRIIKFMNDDIF